MFSLEKLELERVLSVAWFPVCQACLKLEQEGLKQSIRLNIFYSNEYHQCRIIPRKNRFTPSSKAFTSLNTSILGLTTQHRRTLHMVCPKISSVILVAAP